MNHNFFHSIFFILILFSSTLFSQNNIQNSFQSTPQNIKDPISNLRMSGYFRYLGYVRNFQEIYPLDIANYYSGPYPQQTTISVGTGYREPMLMLSISGQAKKELTFGTDLLMNSPFNGDFQNNLLSLYLGSNLYSSLKTSFGNFSLQAGGIKWYRQSKLTAWAEEGYLRYSLFERAPYDPLTKEVSDRYSEYYNKGSISQDLRFGNIAFQGITFTGSSINSFNNSELSFQSILGKTQNNIGELISYGKDDYAAGLRLNNKFSKSNFALNYFTSITATDSVKNNFRQFSIYSSEFDFKIKKIRISGEIGLGTYQSHLINKRIGELILFNLDIPNEYTYIPFKLQYSRIAPEAVNINSSFQNTTFSDLVNTVVIEEGADATILSSLGGPINNLGYLANNREGLSVNTEFNLGDLVISLGTGFYSEIERVNTKFSYNHNSTGLILSRISYFSSGYGPYSQFNSYYRGVFEEVNVGDVYVQIADTTGPFGEPVFEKQNILIDSDSLPIFDKFYCSSDLHLKYKTTLLNKNLYLFSLTNYNTAQDFFSLLPVVNSTAFIRSFNHQLDISYELSKSINLVFKHATERIKCNDMTDIDYKDPYPNDISWGENSDYVPSMKPRDQYGQIFGGGLDIQLKSGAYLFLRHTFFHFYDKNFSATNIKGTESTIELKINF